MKSKLIGAGSLNIFERTPSRDTLRSYAHFRSLTCRFLHKRHLWRPSSTRPLCSKLPMSSTRTEVRPHGSHGVLGPWCEEAQTLPLPVLFHSPWRFWLQPAPPACAHITSFVLFSSALSAVSKSEVVGRDGTRKSSLTMWREREGMCNIVELRTPAMPVGVGGGKERGISS